MYHFLQGRLYGLMINSSSGKIHARQQHNKKWDNNKKCNTNKNTTQARARKKNKHEREREAANRNQKALCLTDCYYYCWCCVDVDSVRVVVAPSVRCPYPYPKKTTTTTCMRRASKSSALIEKLNVKGEKNKAREHRHSHTLTHTSMHIMCMHTNNASQPRTHVPRTQRGESKQVDELCDVDVAAACWRWRFACLCWRRVCV